MVRIAAIYPLFSEHQKCLDLIFIFIWFDDFFYRKSVTPEAWICDVVSGSRQKGYLDIVRQLKCS